MSDRRRILRAIQRESRYIKDPRARRVFKKSAVETGIVESGLTNVAGGDQDSSNWRQERASVYGGKWAQTGGSQNVDASVRRYRQEFQQQYTPGEKSYQASASIQRPRADLRGRYHDVAGQASRLLAGEGDQPNAQQGASYTTTPGVDNSDLRTQAKLAYLQNTHDPNALLTLASNLRQSQDTPGSRVRVPATGQRVAETKSALATAAKQEADAIDAQHYSYQWGGGHNPGVKPSHGTGHGSGAGVGFDCSGAVSKVLGIDARVSGDFAKWGKAGRAKGGRGITVYSNSTHVLMEIDGHLFGTSGSNPGGGAGWIKHKDLPKGYLKNFVARHA